MATYLSRLHHVALHVSNVEKVAHELASRFQFTVFAARLTDRKQLALRHGSAIFVVNERSPEDRGEEDLYGPRDYYPVDTVSNVCFEVPDLKSVARSLHERGECEILHGPAEFHDPRDNLGSVSFCVLRSAVGNVRHTLVERSQYRGDFLPGFCQVQGHRAGGVPTSSGSVTHFDHVTFACTRGSSARVRRWYRNNFGYRRFFIDSDEDETEGYVLQHGGIGLRLTAMENQSCLEPLRDLNQLECKFVMAESLPQHGANQVERFLDEHQGAGIQHIGLYTHDILSIADQLSQAGVQFFSPPPAYYTEPAKQQQILDAGYDPEALSRFGILLDTDERTRAHTPQYLLQVFTKPLFDEDTFFLELIERRGASGFGEGNIRALWRSVQQYMDETQPGDQSEQAQAINSVQRLQNDLDCDCKQGVTEKVKMCVVMLLIQPNTLEKKLLEEDGASRETPLMQEAPTISTGTALFSCGIMGVPPRPAGSSLESVWDGVCEAGTAASISGLLRDLSLSESLSPTCSPSRSPAPSPSKRPRVSSVCAPAEKRRWHSGGTHTSHHAMQHGRQGVALPRSQSQPCVHQEKKSGIKRRRPEETHKQRPSLDLHKMTQKLQDVQSRSWPGFSDQTFLSISPGLNDSEEDATGLCGQRGQDLFQLGGEIDLEQIEKN
ncbi:hypothetical protein DNTS_004319 [Danionella cerebrum]|uniref:4-hydroxyphenylpyruvate dioxygenase n=1 Tax=Danionella cerebrum TaxID=2873325 RepID=A0A553N1V4_9TELE|nr:hypothetical protein DNTS_004319 [Danionella translucida]